uniref:Uncharacterized protein n=1 Tax=Anguilla anguilla TaxID=7936 RepID=A0A0E9W6S3_ANGAN
MCLIIVNTYCSSNNAQGLCLIIGSTYSNNGQGMGLSIVNTVTVIVIINKGSVLSS